MRNGLFFFRRVFFLLTGVLCICTGSFAQTFRPIGAWPDSVNNKIENFLNSTLTLQQRKVAVFDCDGTLFGQAPYYLADEALYSYAKQWGVKTNKSNPSP